MDIRIGTSGWRYPGGRGTWDGVFYPHPADRPRGFDELAFYAERFNTVEVNSTFYGQPRAAVSLGWVRRTPPGFEFAVKLHQKFTHPRMTEDRTPVSQADIESFQRGIEPLAAGGRLGALLAQFPPSFHSTPDARAYLAWLLDTFHDYPTAVELRHRSWTDDPTTGALLADRGAVPVLIDEPKFPLSIEQDMEPSAGTLLYVRLHGRNAAEWWAHTDMEDRYNHLYSMAELQPFASLVRRASPLVRKACVYLNNHFAAQAVANATMVRHLLDDPVRAPMPGEFVARYPALEGLVATSPPARLL